jgi:hypothetical protein
MARADPFRIAGSQVLPGTTETIEVPISRLSNGSPIGLQMRVIHGKQAGPTLFVSSTVHGDEIIGLEIIRRLIERPSVKSLKGTVILVPIVNSYGFLNRSRYLPDRRDLNRCFPGSAKGSLAARLANTFLENVVKKSDYGIDIHSAAIHRENLPQIRISDSDDRLVELATAFGAPVVMRSSLRDGSLRESAFKLGVPTLVYEAGEGLRFDERSIRAGLAGILRVMAHTGMIDAKKIAPSREPSFIANGSYWVRAPTGGLLRLFKKLGDAVAKDERIGIVSDVFGDHEEDVRASAEGVVIGRASLPVINEGDAVAHIARSANADAVSEKMDIVAGQLARADMFYEDEIV